METMSRAVSLKKRRKIFGWIFVVSICVFFASSMLFTIAPMDSMPQPIPPPQNGVPIDPNPPPFPQDHAPNTSGFDTAVIVSGVSLLTSLTSLVGFFSTTVLAWRKEKRETRSAELEIKKKELELEKLRKELGKSKERRKNESA